MKDTANFEFRSIFTALITPFKNNIFDEQAFKNIIEKQIQAGVSGLVPCGTTGESASLSYSEKLQIIKSCITYVDKKIPVIAGVGSNNTSDTVSLAKEAEKLGANGLLIVTPYYNKPTQEGLYQHYACISNSVNIPIILYTVPKRTGVDFTDDTIIRLSKLNNIIGIKDAGNDIARPLRLLSLINKKFYQFSGDDISSLAYNAHGGIGCISVASNIIPELCVKVQNLCSTGNYTKALQIQEKLCKLYDVLFCETNPAPVKYAAHLLGLCDYEVRLPLVSIQDESKILIKKNLEAIKLIKPNLLDEVIASQDLVLF